MATQLPPKKNVAYTFIIGLPSQADTKIFQDTPTIAAGDFKISTDGGAYDNMDNLPTASGKVVTLVISQAEMNGDRIVIVASDAAGAEWCDVMIEIDTTLNYFDDLLGINVALADSVPAAGSLATPAQAMYMLLQLLTEVAVSGTTLTVKKVNGSTTLMTFTINDASNPTSITRTT